MKKIFLIFIMMLAVSSAFSVPFEEWPLSEKERFYDNELIKYGLRDIDGIDYDVKVELVKRLYKRHREERKYYEDLIANPPIGYKFTEDDIRMLKSMGYSIKTVKSDLPESTQKAIEEFRLISKPAWLLEKEAPEETRQINKQDEAMLKFYKSKGENVLLLSIEDLKELDEYKVFQKACKIKNEIKSIKSKGYLKIDENTGEIYTFYDFEKVEALENELSNLNIKYKKKMKAFEDGYYFVFLEK